MALQKWHFPLGILRVLVPPNQNSVFHFDGHFWHSITGLMKAYLFGDVARNFTFSDVIELTTVFLLIYLGAY